MGFAGKMRLAAAGAALWAVIAVATAAAEFSPPDAVCRLETDDVAGLWRAIAPPPSTAARYAALPPAVIAPARLAAFAAARDLADRLAESASRLAAAAFVDDAGRFSVIAGFRLEGDGETADDIALAWETALLLAHPGIAKEQRDAGGTAATVWRLPGEKAEVAAARDGGWFWLANDAELLAALPAGRGAAPANGGVVHMERLLAPLRALPGSIPEAAAREYGGVSYMTLDRDRLAPLAGAVAEAAADFPRRFADAGREARGRSLERLREAWLAAQLAYTENGAYEETDASGADGTDGASGWFTRSGAPQGVRLVAGVAEDDGPEALLLHEAEAWRDGGRRLATQDGTIVEIDEGRFEEMLRRGRLAER